MVFKLSILLGRGLDEVSVAEESWDVWRRYVHQKTYNISHIPIKSLTAAGNKCVKLGVVYRTMIDCGLIKQANVETTTVNPGPYTYGDVAGGMARVWSRCGMDTCLIISPGSSFHSASTWIFLYHFPPLLPLLIWLLLEFRLSWFDCIHW